MLYKRRSRKRSKRLITLLAVLMGITVFFEVRLKPITEAVAEIQAQALATEIINRSVLEILDETGLKTDELETVSYSPDGRVAALSADTVVTNRLKNAVTLRIQENISGITNHQVDIPLGTIIGGEIISGTGPSVPLFISLSGNVRSDFDSSFEQGGLNQTVHRLSLKVNAEINILMPLSSVSTTVETSVLIGETVIVGSVPSGALLRME